MSPDEPLSTSAPEQRPAAGDAAAGATTGTAAEVAGNGEVLRAVWRSAADHVPAWRRHTEGETRWAVIAAVVVAVGLQVALPDRFAPGHRLVPVLELLLAIGLIATHPHRTGRAQGWLRPASLVLVGMISVTNGWSAVRLVQGIVDGKQDDALVLLSSGAAIWATNVIIFALWFWEFDRGGPLKRAHGVHAAPDFVFPQMQNPELSHADWEPHFSDYLYVSFTNSCAFSPTDTMPMARWAKMAMLAQSGISLVTVALVISRAVGLFK
jgi:hypothetical protein